MITLLCGISLGTAGVVLSMLPDFMHMTEYSHVLSPIS